MESLEEKISTRERQTAAQLMRVSHGLRHVSWVREEGEEAVDYVMMKERGAVVQVERGERREVVDDESEYRSYLFEDDDWHSHFE